MKLIKKKKAQTYEGKTLLAVTENKRKPEIKFESYIQSLAEEKLEQHQYDA